MEQKRRIHEWKGLVQDVDWRSRVQIFSALFVLSISMTFSQFGFISVELEGDRVGYILGLLAPVTLATLLLGLWPGTLEGLLVGSVLYLHSRWQPLDLYERYLVSVSNTIGLYAAVAFVLGLLLSVALRNNPQGAKRKFYFGLSCLIASMIASFWFAFSAVLRIINLLAESYPTGEPTVKGYEGEWDSILGIMGDLNVQVIMSFVLMLAICLFTDRIVRYYKTKKGRVSVRTAFKVQLSVVAALVLSVVQAASFIIITARAEASVWDKMGVELDYVCNRLATRMRHYRTLRTEMEKYNLPEDVRSTLMEDSTVDHTIDGYDLSDGTFLIFDHDVVVASYNPFYPVGSKMEDLFLIGEKGTVQDLMQATKPIEIVYDTRSREFDEYMGDMSNAQVGYLRVQRADFGYYVMLATPADMVFSHRQITMRWASLLVFVLLATVYVLVMHLLRQDVVDPIDKTNASLARITEGDLDVVVGEIDTLEFASLSEGINTTVGALKGWIAEAESRMERELATAKAIQESALPRVFPPFPEISEFDIFASMDAAKEVGGDFYDFFLIDDHKLGFLIADVSGKGIPGALFMMAAKTEIENYLSTGMEPSQAIASANRRLCANNDAGMFVTVWAASFDWESGLLTYVNAGHNPPLIRRGRGGSWEWMRKKSGLFLGTFETAKYRQETMQLNPGDELLLYTDGVNEAFNMQEKEYGNDRLEAFLSRHTDTHPRELVRSLRSDVAAWADGAEQSDDVTILALEYGVAPEVTASMTVPATLDHLEEVLAFVSAELERRLCPLGVLHKVEIALEELVVNVCRYAYANREEPGNVQVSYAYSANPSALTVELRDQGVPFDPLKREDPTKPSSIQEAKIGGLGIFMVKKTMDDFVYLRDGDTNVVVFRKGW